MGIAAKYETDFYGWTQEQAALIKAGRFDAIDVENLLEEVESMGRSEVNELEGRIELLFMHLLKWMYQPEYRGRSWVSTIKAQRRKIPKHLQRNPGLKSKLDEIMRSAYEEARAAAADETGLPEQTFPKQCPWMLTEALNQDFWPD
jgi:Domain of unknown function DUF29